MLLSEVKGGGKEAGGNSKRNRISKIYNQQSKILSPNIVRFKTFENLLSKNEIYQYGKI